MTLSQTNGLATAGRHDIAISSLATSQRNFSNQYVSKDAALNSGASFNITYNPTSGDSSVINVSAGNDTPQGVVAAINAASVGVTAVLVQESSDSSQFRIVLQSATGANEGFSITSDLLDSDLGFHDATNGNSVSSGGLNAAQHASDASFTVNGLAVSRSGNLVDDVIPGVSFILNKPHAAGDSDQIFIGSETATLKDKLRGVVNSYNDLQYALNEISSSDSENDELSGALRRDLAAVRTIRDKVYEAISLTSSTSSNGVTAFRDIGVKLVKDGSLEFNELTFDTVASEKLVDISKMLSAGTTNQSRYDEQPQGLAVDAISLLEDLTNQFDGIFASRSATVTTKLANIEADLEALTERTEVIYQRYLKQFTVMETLVSQLNNTRDSMTDTWNNLGLYNNK